MDDASNLDRVDWDLDWDYILWSVLSIFLQHSYFIQIFNTNFQEYLLCNLCTFVAGAFEPRQS